MSTNRELAPNLAALALGTAIIVIVAAALGWLLDLSASGIGWLVGSCVVINAAGFGYLNFLHQGMIRKGASNWQKIALAFASVVIALGSYAFLSHRVRAENPDDRSMPGFAEMWGGVGKIFTPEEEEVNFFEEETETEEAYDITRTPIYMDSAATLTRLFVGMTLGTILAVIVGFTMGTFGPVESLLNPPLSIAAKLNPIAMLAIFFALFQSGEPLFTAMIVFGILPSLAIAVYLSIKHDVPDELIFKSYTLGASHAEVIFLIISRQVLPKIIEGVRAMIGPAVVYLIAAEWMVGSVGFGYQIRIQSRKLDMDVVYPYIAVLALFGYLLDLALVGLLRWLCPWFTKEEPSHDESVWDTIKAAIGLGPTERTA